MVPVRDLRRAAPLGARVPPPPPPPPPLALLVRRSGVARSVRIVTCLEWGAGAETGGASVEELLRGASAVIVFVTAAANFGFGLLLWWVNKANPNPDAPGPE